MLRLNADVHVVVGFRGNSGGRREWTAASGSSLVGFQFRSLTDLVALLSLLIVLGQSREEDCLWWKKGCVDSTQEVDLLLVTVALDCLLGMTDVLGCSLGRQQETLHLP